MTPHILVVDDEKAILGLLSEMLKDEGFLVSKAKDGYEALKQIEREEPDLVLLDIYLPGINGIETLQEIKKIHKNIPVIIISSYGNIDNAVYATKLGAYDFIEKPLSIDKTLVSIHNALEYQRLEEENRFLKKKNLDKNSFNGTSQQIRELQGKLLHAGLSKDNVLIYGENGTGKKRAARNIHFFSSRSESQIININCTSLQKETIEQTLFGCAKNYFGKDTPKIKGKLELSHKNTLFLDEINALDFETQGKLLEFIETKTLSRIGDSREIKIDTRIIASTSNNPDSKENNIRKDLFYRINVINIFIPPLRERKEDIIVLAQHFLDEAYTDEKKIFTKEALELLQKHNWPGNVRELKNFVNSLSIMTEKKEITPEDFPKDFLSFSEKKDIDSKNILKTDNYEDAMAQFKKIFLLKKLEENKNDIKKTAKATGLSEEAIQKTIRDQD